MQGDQLVLLVEGSLAQICMTYLVSVKNTSSIHRFTYHRCSERSSTASALPELALLKRCARGSAKLYATSIANVRMLPIRTEDLA